MGNARRVRVKAAVTDLEAALGSRYVDRVEVASLAEALRAALGTGPNDGSSLERRAWRRIGDAEEIATPALAHL